MAEDDLPGEDIPLDDPRLDEIRRKKKKTNGHSKHFDPMTWVDTDAEIKPRTWRVENHLPADNVTLLSGEGAVGKSILALQECAVTAINAVSDHDHDWLGLLPKGGKAMFVSCEEDPDELNRRLEQIAKHYGASRHDLRQTIRIGSWVNGAGGESDGSTCLMQLDKRTGLLRPTDLFERLQFEVKQFQPGQLTLDTAADLFGGNEISRSDTRQFIAYMRRLAIAANNSTNVMILSHPSLEGIRSGSGLSGSTAWHNSVRSRCVFKHVKAEGEDDEVDPELRVLEWRKNNYGPPQDTITLRYHNGVYVPEGTAAAANLQQQLRMNAVDALFLELLRRRTQQNRPVSDSPGRNYAVTEFESTPEARSAKPRIRSRDLRASMERLLVANRIRVQLEGPPSKPRRRLVEVPYLRAVD